MCRAGGEIPYSDDLSSEEAYDRKPKKKRELTNLEKMVEYQHQIDLAWYSINVIKNRTPKALPPHEK